MIIPKSVHRLHFPFGTTKRTVNIPVSSQNLDAAKTFDVILSNPVGCTIGDHSQAVCTIDPASFSASAADSDGGNETILGAADGEDSSADPVLGASDGRIIGDNPIDLKECQGQAYGRASSYYNSSNQKFEIVAPARYRETVYRPCVSYYFGGDGAYDGFQITWSVGGGSTFGNSATIKVFADNKEIKSYGSASWKMRSEIIRNDSPIKYLRIDVQNNDDGLGDLNVEIEKIVPIKKEFSFTLQQPQPLQFRLPDGSMAANTSTRKFSAAGILEANQTYLDKSDTSGTGTAIRHLNETVTVCMKNPGAYSYIRYLTLTDGHNITEQITEEQDEGTTSVSFVLTKSFLYDYTQKLGMKPLIIIPVMGYRKAVITTDNADVRTTLQPAGSLEKTKGISMGDYYLYNQDAGKYLTRDTVSGNAVGEKASGTASQLWTMSRNDDNQWTITSVLDGKKLDLPLGSSAGLFDFTKDGDSYIISDSNDSPFKLAIVRQEDGSYAAKKQTNRASQKWVLIPAVRSGRYRLRNARSGYYLTAEQAGSSSPAIMSVPAGDSSEVLYIENGSDGICTISNGNGLSLEVSANKEIMFSDSKEGNLQRFRLLPGTEPGEFRICVNDSENILHPVSSGTAGSGFDLQLPTDDIGELWKMDGTEDAQEYECHMGDSYIFSASVKSDYKSSCTMNSIAKIAYEKTTEVSEEQVSLDSSGEISVTAENSRMLLRPVIGQASNSVKLLIRKNDIRFFRSGEGSLKNGAQSYTDKATGIEYWAYTVTPEEIIDDYIWVLEVYTIDGQMTCWTEKGSDKSFSQNRFFYQPDSNKKEQVIYLTSKQSFNKFSIAGKTVMPNSAVSGTGMNDTVSGLGGVTVEAGSAKGISDENGIYDTKAFAGIIGDYIRCRYSISGHTAYRDYKIFYGELKKPTPLNHEEYRYKDGVDAVSFNMNRKGVNTVSSIRAVRINGQTQNEKYFERNVSINKNYTFKLEAEIYNPGHTNQTIKGVDFYSYNADSEKIHAKIGKGTNLKISSPFSYWTCDFSPSASSSSYDAGEKICVILTVYDFNAQKEIRIGPFFNDLTLTLSEDNKPLEQHMQYTNDFFSSLPIIGHLNTALSFKGIQVGIEDLENGGKRFTFGFVPKLGTDAKKKYNGKPMETGEAFDSFLHVIVDKLDFDGNDKFQIPFGDLGFTMRFGLYIDFGRTFIIDKATGTTKAQMEYSGVGIFAGVAASATGNLYVSYHIPIFFGVQGSIKATYYVGAGAPVRRSMTMEDFYKRNTALYDVCRFDQNVEAALDVYAYAGIGFYGIAAVRGGIFGTAKFIVQCYYEEYPSAGMSFQFGARLSIDTFLFSIPVNFPLGTYKTGYYEKVDSDKLSNLSSTDSAQGTVLTRTQSEGDSQWLGGSVNADTGDGKLSSSETENSTTILNQNGYDHPDSKLISLGGNRTLLVFLDKGSDSSHTVLKYSIYNGTSWTEPAVIQNDGRNDYQPNLCDAGDSVMISWTSSGTEDADGSYGTTSEKIAYLQTLDVYTVVMDKASGTLGEITRLTNDGYMDSTPVGICDTETKDRIVYYLKSAARTGNNDTQALMNTVLPTQNDSVLTYMLYDSSRGKWDTDFYYDSEVAADKQPEMISQWKGQRFLSSPISDFNMADPAIADFTAISYDGIGVYAYTIDQDNNTANSEDRELFIQLYDFKAHKTYLPIRVTSDARSDSRPQLIRNGDSTLLFWLKDSSEIDYIDVSVLVKEGINADGSIKDDNALIPSRVYHTCPDQDNLPTLSSFTPYADKDGNLYVAWLQAPSGSSESRSREVFASEYTGNAANAEGTAWSEGVQITHSGKFNDEAALLVQDSGTLLIVNDQFDMDTDASGTMNENGNVASDVKLVATDFRKVGSLAVTAIAYSDDTPKPGDSITVTSTIKNTGLNNADGYRLSLYENRNGTKGSLIGTVFSDDVIVPSGTGNAEIQWTVPQLAENLGVICEVTENGYSETGTLAADPLKITPEFTISSRNVVQEEGGFHLTCTVTNTGSKDYTEADAESRECRLMIGKNLLYSTDEAQDPYEQIALQPMKMGESQIIDVLLDIPGDQFTNGYLNAVMWAADKDGSSLSDSDTFSIGLYYPTDVYLKNADSDIITLEEGQTMELSGEYAPTDYFKDGTILYSVDDPSVASAENGTLTAIDVGTTQLNLSVDPYGLKKSYMIRVKADTETRLWGATRYETMLKGVMEAFPLGSKSVVLASGENWPDALAASSLAGVMKCPVIFTEQKKLSSQAYMLLKKLGTEQVTIVGGTAAISDEVKKDLIAAGITEGNIERLWGDDRMQTAERIAERVMKDSTSDTCFIASGNNFPDALSASAYAYIHKIPILLTGSDGMLTDTTKAMALKFKNAVIIGGAQAVSGKTEDQLKEISVERYSGQDRYETSKKFIDHYYDVDIPVVVLASGENFPDALVGAPIAGMNGGAVLLANGLTEELNDSQKTVIQRTDYVWLMGGEAAMSAPLEKSLVSAMQ
ncbi:MAG: cell wall-binding repeat-containing protein [Lachnospiraceae bacterium]|nr:cell wall-binding repeat-containing protein [Lachnospiraceae bacterium]